MYQTLITPAQLIAHLDDPNWVIFDCRFAMTQPELGHQQYLSAHIPHARYADLDKDLASAKSSDTGRHPLPTPHTLAHKLSLWGVDKNTQVIIYDDSAGSIAVRMWWLLRWLGHSSVAVLNGGFPRWQKEGLPVSHTPSHPTVKEFIAQPDDSLWVTTHVLEEHLKTKAWLLIDARAPERFRGEQEPLDPVAGHIPSAINLPFSGNLDVEGNFLSADLLHQRFAHLNGHPNIKPDHIIHSCGSGVTACHNLLAMEAAGLQGSKLYAGSWSEWITDSQRPIAKGE
ncbi:sulfurtransferase [Beggiatoa leptomitoformis]|uniref:Sulfurtransferase n=1 Tax=Beggiatoa leptomitoformis TaxID=288004 RepID=A0A2N9YFD4_9GAMM|nr:sulfurtransferase [Beggiatoa leptomitoformis]ALG68549.1 sulfurtransferase [Beggiatoa leptomitoformis]AUI69105.1 sulfurtransferase [Beggiatoa leptomitoformis]